MMKNGYIWKVTIVDTPIFDFHDDGRKYIHLSVFFGLAYVFCCYSASGPHIILILS